MAKKNSQSIADKQAAKKSLVLGRQKKSPLPWIAALACAVLIAAAAGLFFLKRAGDAPTSASSTQVMYPTSQFDDGKARFFQYRLGDGPTIRYFILKSSDGIIRAAFDACDVCWPANKGYYQMGDYMVCRNCGRRFASVRVNEVRGGCNPAPLARTVVDGKLVIEVKDILQGQPYFDFQKGA